MDHKKALTFCFMWAILWGIYFFITDYVPLQVDSMKAECAKHGAMYVTQCN
jgi:hypothetical protein